MIEIRNLSKLFGNLRAVNCITFEIEEGSIFGLVGSNGAGKSTLLRMISGVYQADEGEILIDGAQPYENIDTKNKILYISDYPYFFNQSSIDSMAEYYRHVYRDWSEEKFQYLKSVFPLDPKMKISQMSKGMQRQAAIVLGFSTLPKYILFDEIFDGLDPVIRELLKKILVDFVAEQKATVLIASHNLRELEDLCDHVGLLHKGGVIFERELDDLKLGLYRIQAAFQSSQDFEDLKQKLTITKATTRGRMIEFTAKGDKDEIYEMVNAKLPLICEVLPLTLEEVFISEMEVAGYDINNLIQ